MVQWVYESAKAAMVTDHVYVATPDREILQVVRGFGGEGLITSMDAPTGTDRIAEAARELGASAYVNVQGDEPLMPAVSIKVCAEALLEGRQEMASVFCWCSQAEVADPAVVKVVTDARGYALYFSRHGIPYEREARVTMPKRHIGLYGYSADALRSFAEWPRDELEIAESLEQLRFLANGVRIRMAYAEGPELAVDLPEHAETVRRLLRERRDAQNQR